MPRKTFKHSIRRAIEGCRDPIPEPPGAVEPGGDSGSLSEARKVDDVGSLKAAATTEAKPSSFRSPSAARPLQEAGCRERLAYSIQDAADLLGVNYYSVYRLIRRGKLKACRALRGKVLVPRAELLRLLSAEE